MVGLGISEPSAVPFGLFLDFLELKFVAWRNPESIFVWTWLHRWTTSVCCYIIRCCLGAGTYHWSQYTHNCAKIMSIVRVQIDDLRCNKKNIKKLFSLAVRCPPFVDVFAVGKICFPIVCYVLLLNKKWIFLWTPPTLHAYQPPPVLHHKLERSLEWWWETTSNQQKKPLVPGYLKSQSCQKPVLGYLVCCQSLKKYGTIQYFHWTPTMEVEMPRNAGFFFGGGVELGG